MNQILFYNDEEMQIYEVVNFQERQAERAVNCVPIFAINAEITTHGVKAELDPTTMKRIAKYNLEKDFEELNSKIKSAEDRLKILNEQIETQEEKAGFIRELTRRIWNDPCFDQDNYLPDEDENYTGDGWE